VGDCPTTGCGRLRPAAQLDRNRERDAWAANEELAATSAAASSSSACSSDADNGVLHALAHGVDGGNGIYRHGSGRGLMVSSVNASNYRVDVVHQAWA